MTKLYIEDTNMQNKSDRIRSEMGIISGCVKAQRIERLAAGDVAEWSTRPEDPVDDGR